MSYETPQQKQLLLLLQQTSANCFHAGISYGKALTALNSGYGTEKISKTYLTMTEQALSKKDRNKRAAEISGKRAAALVLSRMTGQQVRLAQRLPEDMAKQVNDDQLVGDVFTLDQLEAIL